MQCSFFLTLASILYSSTQKGLSIYTLGPDCQIFFANFSLTFDGNCWSSGVRNNVSFQPQPPFPRSPPPSGTIGNVQPTQRCIGHLVTSFPIAVHPSLTQILDTNLSLASTSNVHRPSHHYPLPSAPPNLIPELSVVCEPIRTGVP
jgi:hypothetical protein